MKSEELKPCPFCGGEAAIVYDINSVYVKCIKCHCQTIAMVSSVTYCAQDCVTERWNRRDDNG